MKIGVQSDRLKYFLLTLLVVFTIFIGFLRDFIFVSINAIIESGKDNSHLAEWKWVLTLVFCMIYTILSCAYIYLLFYSRKYVLIAILVHLLFILVAIALTIVCMPFFSFPKIYPFVRTLLGVVQSPIIIMILIPSFLLGKQSSSQ